MHVDVKEWAGELFQTSGGHRYSIQHMQESGFPHVIRLFVYDNYDYPMDGIVRYTYIYDPQENPQERTVFNAHEALKKVLEPIVKCRWTFTSLHSWDEDRTNEPSMMRHTIGFEHEYYAALVKATFDGRAIP